MPRLMVAQSNLNVPGPMQVENQGAQREGEGGAPGLDIALEHKMVRVLIEDQRHTPSKKSLAIIKLNITKGDHANKWGVQAGELWRELQNSLACISGPAKISYPDPITPEYSQCIVNKATNQDAATLEGPSNGAQRHRCPAHEVHSAEDLKSKKNAACTLNNQVIAWLRDQASNQPGHDTFMESRGKTLQNPKIVQAWRFATTFVDQYAWKSFEIPGPEGTTQRARVKKAQAKEALKLSDSSFGRSQRGAYLVEKYREAAEVQEMLEY
ncbi:hypothetical protein DFH94DRAFT_685163 [Russula ochroleuca]|uniref:Uncharacterized protein n=1 Tax=Russula ochroleuca TaxID=152965 RepID=A0A9P5MPP3_9AGAM|nr:hypothetical protein DFH94DRAFT_685163 [Russula ochroleuca]